LAELKQAVRNYSSITHLDVSSNMIREISLKDLPLGLHEIALNNNNLTSLSTDILKMPKLTLIRLAGNKYECGCESKPLYDFFRTDSSKVADRNNIVLDCKDVSTPLVNMELSDFCVIKGTLHLLLPLLILLVILLTIVVLVMYYKTPICIWLYSKPNLRWIFALLSPESDAMKYDVFISFSDQDKGFVEGTLLKELENGSDIQYRCLVHSRSFIPGCNIMEQIKRAVDNSRRTLIILSKNFVSSDWYRHEFGVAHGAKRVVVVVLGDLPTREEMGELMWEYIKTNTYLPYGGEEDKWFWDKLRYALPHKNQRHVRFMRIPSTQPLVPNENATEPTVELNDPMSVQIDF
jgi:protein toll